MKSISYFEFNTIYQGMNIIDARTGKKLLKAAVFNAFRHKEYVLFTLEQNSEFIIEEKTSLELREWDRAIQNTSGSPDDHE